MTSLSDLPYGCLVHILELLPQQQRLGNCACVCSAWRKAAVAATTTVCNRQPWQPVSTATVSQALQWAGSLGRQHVRSISLYGPCSNLCQSGTPVPLDAFASPLAGLQHLQLEGVVLNIPSQHSRWPDNPLQPLSNLTSLCLGSGHKCVILQHGLEQLSALSALQRLQQLTTHCWVPALQQGLQPARHWTLPSSDTWSRLTALTRFELGLQRNVTDEALQQLCSGLTALQELVVCAAQLTPPGLNALSSLQKLQSLAITFAPHISFSTTTTPALLQLPLLTSLSLFYWRLLQPAFLGQLRQLQHLELGNMSHWKCTTAEGAEVLEALPHLSNLTALHCEWVFREPKDPLPLHAAVPQQQQQQEQQQQQDQQQELSAAAYAALTASRQLQSLTVEGADLPAGAWLHAFPARQQLLQLKRLRLGGLSTQLSDGELSQLVACCPGLSGLTLVRALPLHADMQPLLQLPALQELELQHIHGSAAINVLSRLTGLQRLEGKECSARLQSLQPLTALRRLTQLFVGYSYSLSVSMKDIRLKNQAASCFMPDVCSQLQALIGGAS